MGEHGLAFWVETNEHCLLFDTGQGLVLANNAGKLKLDLDAVDTVVLSHGHYDHTGGLASLLRCGTREVRLYAHPDALLPKYSKKDGTARKIGIPFDSRQALLNPRSKLIKTCESAEVARGAWATGEIPRHHCEEVIEDAFFLDPEGNERDSSLDDQALFIETERGLVVLLGCAHSGVINTLDHVQHLAEDKPICSVIGGMHLSSASGERVAWTIAELRRFDLQHLAPMHCTGMKASAALWNTFSGIYATGGVGSVYEF